MRIIIVEFAACTISQGQAFNGINLLESCSANREWLRGSRTAHRNNFQF